jgi:hypothetical protein
MLDAWNTRGEALSLAMRTLVVAMIPLMLCGVGCGGVARESPNTGQRASPTSPAGSRAVDGSAPRVTSRRLLRKWDHDGDAGPADEDVPNSPYDGDDNEIRYYGRAANAPEAQAVIALIDRYYKAAAQDDGAVACSLLDASLTRSLVEEQAQVSDQARSSGKTCATLMSEMFKHVPRRSAADFAAVEVTGVRVQGDEGLALLRLQTSEVRDIPVSREGGAWKVEAFLDSGLS